MKGERDEVNTEPTDDLDKSGADASTKPLSRRAVLRGAAVAAPAIVTMNSASASLAMTSVRTYTSTDAAQPDGNYYCLAEKSTLGPPAGGSSDALQTSSASMPNVDYYGERDYRKGDNSSASPISEVDMCRTSDIDGTTYYYKNSGWQPINVKRGILMSAAAMGSLGVSAVKIDNL